MNNHFQSPTAQNVLMSAFVAVEGAHAFSAFLPSIFTIRHFALTEDAARSIRDGELMGTFFALSLGAVVSSLLSTKLPLVFAAVTSAAMVSVYEYALRTRELGAPQTESPVRPVAGLLEAA